MDETRVISDQLGRMRGMTRFYHERFFSDVRTTTLTVFTLLVVGWWDIPQAFLLVPVAALIGANQTAFDASYLYFARHYASALEDQINARLGKRWLVGAEMEDRYLFPLSSPKVVSVATGDGFSFFGWMTIFYTLAGGLAYLGGLALGWETLTSAGVAWTAFYVLGLVSLTVGSVAAGAWWFVSGQAERRLESVLVDLPVDV